MHGSFVGWRRADKNTLASFKRSQRSRASGLQKRPPSDDKGDPDPISAGTAGDAARGADQARRWGWRRPCPEPTRPAEFSPAACRSSVVHDECGRAGRAYLSLLARPHVTIAWKNQPTSRSIGLPSCRGSWPTAPTSKCRYPTAGERRHGEFEDLAPGRITACRLHVPEPAKTNLGDMPVN